jgi:hypothetical protein
MPKTISNRIANILMRKLPVALLAAGCLPAAFSQQQTGRLSVYGVLQPSYYAEARSEGFVSVGQGVAEGRTLRVPAQPGAVSIRVSKANSSSPRYTLVISGSKDEVRMRDLPYGAPVTVTVPEGSGPVTLYVLPE